MQSPSDTRLEIRGEAADAASVLSVADLYVDALASGNLYLCPRHREALSECLSDPGSEVAIHRLSTLLIFSQALEATPRTCLRH